MQYDIIIKSSIADLEDAVRGALAEGKVLAGGVSSWTDDSKMYSVRWFMQAVAGEVNIDITDDEHIEIREPDSDA